MAFEKKSEGPVNVTFTAPSFRHKGVVYQSAEVEKAAEEGNEEALALVATLVQIGSGIVSVVSAEEQPEAAEGAPAPKASKKKGGNK